MNRFLISTVSILICTLLQVQNCATHAQEPKDTTYAVFVYCDKSVTTPLNALRSELVSSLVNNSHGRYHVVDRTEEILSLLRKEHQYEGSGMVRDDQLIKIGEHLAANYIVAIRVTNYKEYNQYFFDCDIVGVENREILKHTHYPNTSDANMAVTQLDPQNQIRVGKELAEQFNTNICRLKISAKMTQTIKIR